MPFQPFEIETNGGKRIPVTHTDTIMFSEAQVDGSLLPLLKKLSRTVLRITLKCSNRPKYQRKKG
jgi:hypothetical protein